MSTSRPRKPTGSFVNDPSVLNLMQLTPRTELYHSERSPFTMASHSSKTNFIGDSVITEGPRAVAVTETGERHSLHLDDEVVKAQAQTNLLVSNNAVSDKSNDTNINRIEQLPDANAIQLPTESTNTSKSSKRNKATRRYINQKPRPVFTPRNMASCSTTEDLHERSELQLENRENRECERDRKHDWERDCQRDCDCHRDVERDRERDRQRDRDTYRVKKDPIKDGFMERTKPSKITNVQTQTETNATKLTRQYQPIMSPPSSTPPPLASTLHLAPRKYMRESVGDILDTPRRQPLRIVPPKRAKNKSYSELRNIASALTLITVVSWLFSTFFELDGLLELLSAVVGSVQTWFVEKRQPKTRMEMLVDYLHSWWS